MLRRLVVPVTVALVGAFVFAPSAFGATTSVADYVNGVCNSLTSFRDDVDALEDEFQARLEPLTELPDVKAELVSFFGELLATTTQLRADLQAAGTPEMEDGGAISKALRDGIKRMESAIADVRADARALRTSRPARFTRDADALGKKLDKAFETIGNGFDDLDQRYDTKALETAQDGDPDCSTLN